MWTADDWNIQRLKVVAWNTWDKQARINIVETIASYGKPAINALIDLATFTWDYEFRAFVLDKIRNINSFDNR